MIVLAISFLPMVLWSSLWVYFKVKWFVKRLRFRERREEIVVYRGWKRLIEFILLNMRERETGKKEYVWRACESAGMYLRSINWWCEGEGIKEHGGREGFRAWRAVIRRQMIEVLKRTWEEDEMKSSNRWLWFSSIGSWTPKIWTSFPIRAEVIDLHSLLWIF